MILNKFVSCFNKDAKNENIVIRFVFNIYFPYNSFCKIKIGKNEIFETKLLSLRFKLSRSTVFK